MARVLFITDDRLGAKMAGPAIRVLELATRLAARHEVSVAALQAPEPGWVGPVAVHACASGAALVEVARGFEVLVAGGFVFAQHPALQRLGKYLVLDLYDPMLLEDLALSAPGKLGAFLYREHHRWLEDQMRAADFMVAASERQRDYWLGRLCALGRLGPATYAEDPTARRLLEVVPFGLNETPPTPGAPRLRGVLPGIEEGDRLLLWGGGIWEWFDPLTPIEAIARLAPSHPNLKLVFLAASSPNPTTPPMAMAARARELAERLGVLGRSVHFYESWVPYAERGALLLEADAGFTAHREHLETRFSFRTRVLDYLWAGLPVLTTSGDAMGDWVERHDLGAAIAPQDVEGWVQALRRVAEDPAWLAASSERVKATSGELSWSRVIAPLAAYCAAPYHTPKSSGRKRGALPGPLALVAKAALALGEEGPQGLLARVRRYRDRRRAPGARHD